MKEVIIIGAARSGTKILRDTLAQAFDWGRVPYDIEYVWHAQVATKHDEFSPRDLSSDSVRYVRRFIQKYGLGRRAVVEKTVGNSLRVPAVHKVFPDALYVHLVRDGVDVVESATRQWQAPTNYTYVARKLRHFPISQAPTYGVDYLRRSIRRGRSANIPVWGPRYKGIEADAKDLPVEVVCARQWARCVSSATRGFEDAAGAHVLDVRYEDFVGNPNLVLEQVAEASGMKPNNGGRVAAVASIQRPAEATARPKYSPEVASAIAEIIDPELRHLNYPEFDVVDRRRCTK